MGILIGTIAAVTAPTKVIVSGGAAFSSMTLDVTRAHARSVRHWTLPDVPIQIAPLTFTEWAKGGRHRAAAST